MEGQTPYPNATAPAIANPRAADFPRPRAAVRATVLLRVFSEIPSMNFKTALACTNKNTLGEWRRAQGSSYRPKNTAQHLDFSLLSHDARHWHVLTKTITKMKSSQLAGK